MGRSLQGGLKAIMVNVLYRGNMDNIQSDLILKFKLLSNQHTAFSFIKENKLLLPSGHIDLQRCFLELGLSNKYYLKRIDRHFNRLNVRREDFDYVLNGNKQNLLLPKRYAVDIISHTAKNLMIYGRAVNDLRYYGGINTSSLLSYKPWKAMFERCYDPAWHARKPHYQVVEVCPEWHLFSNFNEWFFNNFPEHLKNKACHYTLNREVFKGNCFYSADTCFFIPKSLSNFISGIRKEQTDFPIGVSRRKNSKERVQVKLKIKGQRYSLGTYDYVNEASSVYQKARWLFIAEVAYNYYKSDMVTEDFVYACRERLELESINCPISDEAIMRKIRDWENLVLSFGYLQ